MMTTNANLTAKSAARRTARKPVASFEGPGEGTLPVHTSKSLSPRAGRCLERLGAALQERVGDEYVVVAGERFRVGREETVTANLAVLSRTAYEWERRIRPHTKHLETVPLLVVLVEPDGTADRSRNQYSFPRRGTNTVWALSLSRHSMRVVDAAGDRLCQDSVSLPLEPSEPLPLAEFFTDQRRNHKTDAVQGTARAHA